MEVSIIDAVKDIYLVGKFVYRTIGSALHESEERDEIERKFSTELLHLQSFGQWFVKQRRIIVDDPDLDQQWLENIIQIFEILSELFGEYRLIAEKTDHEYRNFSPLFNKAMLRTGKIEFPLGNVLKPNRESVLSRIFGNTTKSLEKSKFIIGSKWALFQKSRLERVVTDFRSQNDAMQRVLFLAMAHQRSPNLDQAFVKDQNANILGIAKHAQLKSLENTSKSKEQLLLSPEKHKIQVEHEGSGLCQAVLQVTVAKGNVVEDPLLVEYKSFGEDPFVDADFDTSTNTRPLRKKTKESIQKLAILLNYSGSEKLGTLPLRGFLPQPAQGRTAFLFDYPDWAIPGSSTSLHESIRLTKEEPWNLAIRFATARRMAELIGNLHICRWLHKNISSRSLEFFVDIDTKKLNDTRPFLVDFEYSRPDTGSTTRLFEADPKRLYYLHPAIQQVNRPAFRRVHDIYSLGVVLLEIALWQCAEDIVQYAFPDAATRTPDSVRRHYIKIAQSQIPHRMGLAYLEVVIACIDSESESKFSGTDFPQNFRAKIVDKLSPNLLSVI